ncbi:hypothetical protein C8R47DRAFT_234094 [Mycena vitilis]|nr:hypothetical protein C8R47DRAFT_234094 [Mycena vitilis]
MIRGMALWWSPGVEPFSTEEQRRGLSAFVSKLSQEAQQWHSRIGSSCPSEPIHPLTLTIQYRPGFANLTEKLLGPRGKLDSWYLNLLAVDPEHQRLGVARALIDTVRRKAGRSELTLAATNEMNVSIYRRMGFAVRGSMIMSGPQGEFPVFVLSQPGPAPDRDSQ